MSIFFALPVYGSNIMYKYMSSLIELQRDMLQSDIPHTLAFLNNESAIHRARNQLVKRFLETDYEALMFIDSDIGFKPIDVAKLWALNADIAVGCYRMKKPGSKYAAWVNGKLVDDLDQFDEPIEVDYAGTGFMLIRREVFEVLETDVITEKVPGGTRKRYFTFDNVQDGVELAEDYNFCMLARSTGHKVVMDPTVRLKHYGLYAY